MNAIRINHLTIEKLTERLLTVESADKVACLIRLSSHYDSCDDNKTAMFYAECAFELAIDLRSTELTANCHLQIAAVYHSQMQYWLSEKNYRTALDLFQKINHPDGQAKAYYFLGEYFWTRNKLKEAWRALQKSSKLYRRLGDERGLGRCYDLLGKINEYLNKHEKALRCFLDAYQLTQKWERNIITVELMIRIGNILMELKRFEESLEYHRQAYGLAIDYNDKYLQNEASYGIGYSHLVFGEFTTASEWFEKTLLLSNEIADRVLQKRAQNCYVHCQLKLGISRESNENNFNRQSYKVESNANLMLPLACT